MATLDHPEICRIVSLLYCMGCFSCNVYGIIPEYSGCPGCHLIKLTIILLLIVVRLSIELFMHSLLTNIHKR